jgi:hypothetical protein
LLYLVKPRATPKPSPKMLHFDKGGVLGCCLILSLARNWNPAVWISIHRLQLSPGEKI